MKPQTLLLFFLIVLILTPVPAMADCKNLIFKTLPATNTFQGETTGYSVYDGSEYLQSVSFTVEAEATSGGCLFFTGLSTGQSGNFTQRVMTQGTHSLNYNVYTSANKSTLLKEPPHATADQVIAGYFYYVAGKKQTATLTYHWTIIPGQDVPYSIDYYEDPGVVFNLYSGIPTLLPKLVASKIVTFRTKVNSHLDISLVDAGEDFDSSDTTQQIDFGTIASGAERSFNLAVRGNSGYTVNMQSQNGQVLKNPAASTTISYNIFLNGSPLSLASRAMTPVLSVSAPTPATGQAFPVRFSIDQLTGKEITGTYSDVIAVEVIAK